MLTDIAIARRTAAFVARAGVAMALIFAAVAASASRGAAQSTAASARPDASLSVQIDSLLDLPTVIRRALEVSPTAVSGQEFVRAARSEERVAQGAYLPSLSVNSSVLRSSMSTSPVAGAETPASYSAGLASSVDVYTGGRRAADRLRARADLTAAEASDVSQRFAVTLLAQRAFYETLRAGDLVDVARARVTQAERGYRYAQDRVRAGTTTKSDELRARLELTSGRQQLVAALDTMQSSAYALGRLIGANGPIGGNRTTPVDPRALSLSDSEIVRMAIDASPSVRTARAREQAEAAVTRSARTQYLPGLRVTGGYNWANQAPVVGGVRPGWSIALGTSYPLFNGFQREDAVTRADVAAEIARVTALDVTRQARTEAARLLRALRFAEQNISLAQEAVTSAREDLRVQSERYQAGISTELDELTSELALTQAQLSLVAARFNYSITRAQLEALVGREL